MKSKTLKIELSALFVLTIISFYAFYYQDVLPDNIFTISSSSDSYGFFSYYLTSIVALVGYYLGPWLLFPFLTFAFCYAFIFSKRDFFLDVFVFIPLLGFFLIGGYFFSESLLGHGTSYLIKKTLTTPTMVLAFLSFGILFFAITFRSSFKDYLLSGLKNVRQLPFFLTTLFQKTHSLFTDNNVGSKIKRAQSLLKLNVTKYLKEDREHLAPVALPSTIENQNHELESYDLDETTDERINEEKSVEESTLEGEGSQSKVQNEKKKRVFSLKSGLSKEKEDKQYYQLVMGISHKKHSGRAQNPDEKYFTEIISLIEEKLSEFKIDGKICNVLKGPVVDTFELDLGSGVKVSKVTSSAEDLSLALYGAPIRIVYPMKGRTTIGIEVPRNPREIIYLDEVLNSKDFQRSDYKLPLAMGKDAFGETFVTDLAAMPHMLVAGATGAGKSVFINSLLVSLLVKKSPSQMKLILIDPKQLELALYARLPHLVMPVITEAKSASIALLWAVQEMERRYSILKEFGVRNIDGFNDKLKRATPEMLSKIHQHYEDFGDDEGYELPYLVIIVDEFADLILTKAGKEIENNICRLAAKARAAGIHLVIATQRPSVDVITGLIKSNFPTRVSFRVTTSVDSRTILNAVGAEKLLGKGDMLYKHGVDTSRVHSSYVDEEEIEILTDKLSEMNFDFRPSVMDFLENGGEQEKDPYSFGSHISSPKDEGQGKDDLYEEAVRVVAEHRSASASMLQRRLRIGYNRAANLIEEMEDKGVVGPAQGSKPRRVLVSSDGAMRNI